MFNANALMLLNKLHNQAHNWGEMLREKTWQLCFCFHATSKTHENQRSHKMPDVISLCLFLQCGFLSSLALCFLTDVISIAHQTYVNNSRLKLIFCKRLIKIDLIF